jgi:hypothetical protein
MRYPGRKQTGKSPDKGMTMIFKLKTTESSFVRPRVTPDPDQAEMLQRKMNALNYSPANGFHRDMRQCRQTPAMSRMAR